jgi:hypothetical protein
VQELEARARHEAGLPQEKELEHYEQAALHRRVLEEALVESGLLFIKRRRIPQKFFDQKPANILGRTQISRKVQLCEKAGLNAIAYGCRQGFATVPFHATGVPITQVPLNTVAVIQNKRGDVRVES